MSNQTENQNQSAAMPCSACSSLQRRIKRLERFMEMVAKEVQCLPDYCCPDVDNSHIINAIRKLKQNTPDQERKSPASGGLTK